MKREYRLYLAKAWMGRFSIAYFVVRRGKTIGMIERYRKSVRNRAHEWAAYSDVPVPDGFATEYVGDFVRRCEASRAVVAAAKGAS